MAAVKDLQEFLLSMDKLSIHKEELDLQGEFNPIIFDDENIESPKLKKENRKTKSKSPSNNKDAKR